MERVLGSRSFQASTPQDHVPKASEQTQRRFTPSKQTIAGYAAKVSGVLDSIVVDVFGARPCFDGGSDLVFGCTDGRHSLASSYPRFFLSILPLTVS